MADIRAEVFFPSAHGGPPKNVSALPSPNHPVLYDAGFFPSYAAQLAAKNRLANRLVSPATKLRGTIPQPAFADSSDQLVDPLPQPSAPHRGARDRQSLNRCPGSPVSAVWLPGNPGPSR